MRKTKSVNEKHTPTGICETDCVAIALPNRILHNVECVTRAYRRFARRRLDRLDARRRGLQLALRGRQLCVQLAHPPLRRRNLLQIATLNRSENETKQNKKNKNAERE